MAGRHYTKKGYADEVDIENFLLLDINDTFSAQIEDWIAAAEQQVDRYLGYTTASGIFAEQVQGETVRGLIDTNMDLMLFPRKFPIIDVTGIDLTKGTSTLTLQLTNGAGVPKYNIPATANYILYPQYELNVTGSTIINSFAVLRNQKFFTKMTYRAGYTEVPPDIRLAVVNLVADVIMRHTNKEALKRLQQGRVSKEWAERQDGTSDFVRDAYELLRPYRISSSWII